mgnify:CR=1 FL=1
MRPSLAGEPPGLKDSIVSSAAPKSCGLGRNSLMRTFHYVLGAFAMGTVLARKTTKQTAEGKIRELLQIVS